MKNVICRVSAITVMACAAAWAQNSDLGLLVGVSVRASSTVTPGLVKDSVSASGQINYALQLRETAAGRLYLELPLLITSQNRVEIASSIAAANSTTVFFTPGVRWHYTVHPRVALYAAAGGGVAVAGGNSARVGSGGVSVGNGTTTTGAFGFGGGMDVRLTRLLSLRAEGRDFITRAGFNGDSGRNHPFFTVGVGFHF